MRALLAAALIVAAAPAWAGADEGPSTAAGQKLDAQLRAGKITCMQWVKGLEAAGDEWERAGGNWTEANDSFATKWAPLTKRCKTEFYRKTGTLQPPEE